METLAWWGLGLGVVVIVGMLVAAIIIQRINMTGLQAIIASQAETIDAVRAERDDTVARHKEAAGRASDVLMQNADKALAERNEAIARRKEAADRANVLEGKVRLLESELTGTVRRCDVEMARLREAWEARIAELELERDRERFERDQAWQQHDRAAAEWDKQKAIADALADQNKQLADAHDALAAEHDREIADLRRDLNATVARWRNDCEKYQALYWQVRDAMAAERQRTNEAKAVQG